jgi:hypothetical protein
VTAVGKKNPAEAAIAALIDEFAAAARRLADQPCPQCGTYSLEVEIRPSGGVHVSCDGFDASTEDGNCAFSRVHVIKPEKSRRRVELVVLPCTANDGGSSQ